MKHIIKQILKEEGQKQNIFVPYNLEKRKEDYEKLFERKTRPAKEEFKEMLLKYQVDLSLGNKIYYDENGDWVFEYDSKNKWLWIQYHRIWSVFESKYGLNYNQIKKLTEDTVREVYKIEGVTTGATSQSIVVLVREVYKIEGVTTIAKNWGDKS